MRRLTRFLANTGEKFLHGTWAEASVEEIVPGDIVLLNAGNIIPGNCLILESKDLSLAKMSFDSKAPRLGLM